MLPTPPSIVVAGGVACWSSVVSSMLGSSPTYTVSVLVHSVSTCKAHHSMNVVWALCQSQSAGHEPPAQNNMTADYNDGSMIHCVPTGMECFSGVCSANLFS